MEILKIDDKWSVEYDPDNNDRPVSLLRYGDRAINHPSTWDNAVTAMFYALLDTRSPKFMVNSVGSYYAPDGTLMNADGTRSIFDDVDD